MALQKEHRPQIIKDYFQDKQGVPQEHSPSTFKSGEEMPITKVNGFYKADNVEGVFTCRVYAEQAYREYLRSIELPKLDKEIKNVKKRAKAGLANDFNIKKAEEKKEEWLETH